MKESNEIGAGLSWPFFFFNSVVYNKLLESGQGFSAATF